MAVGDVPRVLLVDSDAGLRRSLRRVLSSHAAVDEAASCEDASRALRQHASYAAFVVEVALRDGSGLDWLASARHARHFAPALVLTSQCEPRLIGRAFELDARYLCKPTSHAHLRMFAVFAVFQHRGPAVRAPVDPIGDCVRRWTLQYGLTPSEAAAVGAALRSPVVAGEVAAARGITKNTFKTLVRRALRKLGVGTIAELRSRVLDSVADRSVA
jgi:DNA-binding NarL/FixJ family response regulator